MNSISAMELNKIKEILDKKGISQTWLAKQLGKSYSTVNAYSCNRVQPSLETLFEIAKILEVGVLELINTEKNVRNRKYKSYI
jgi:putative transcriptional regulator